jgi:predicted lipoprotein with Yx(FWY)xxD motif
MSPTLRKFLPALLAAAFVATLAIQVSADGEAASLALAEREGLGSVLVDGHDMTLYALTSDVTDAGTVPTCYGDCATNWPPLLAGDADVALGEGLDAALLGSVDRADGTKQVTYGGWPLYFFIRDTEAGQANGQAVGDRWYVVAADGSLTGLPAAAAPDMTEMLTVGAGVYERICAACHGAEGNQALQSHVPLLAANSRLGNERLVVRRVIHGNGYMPGFGTVLSDDEVAAVATFVRNSFGNEFGMVSEEVVKAAR